MRIQICAIGRLRSGPERDLVDDYLDRFNKVGRAHGLGPATVTSLEDKKNAGSAAEAELIRRALPKTGVTCALDERGQTLSSPEFAEVIARWRDEGQQEASFLIGGADGLTHELRDSADLTLSLGKMVWPHLLARVMLSEQLYRAASILANMPYHRA